MQIDVVKNDGQLSCADCGVALPGMFKSHYKNDQIVVLCPFCLGVSYSKTEIAINECRLADAKAGEK